MWPALRTELTGQPLDAREPTDRLHDVGRTIGREL